MSASDTWIIIPSWGRFQHYKDRDPPWIKLHTELNSKPEWLDLTYAERGLLATLWVEYCRSHGQLSVRSMARLGSVKGMTKDSLTPYESLSRAGFIQLSASKPLALARSREAETQTLEETERSSSSLTLPLQEARPLFGDTVENPEPNGNGFLAHTISESLGHTATQGEGNE